MIIDNKLILENSKSLNVLYIEDDEELRNSTSQLLNNFFKSVDTAVDGVDGYEKYQLLTQRTDEVYDLIISDVNMPNMDGLEMYKKIKEINHNQVIIIVTAHNETSYLHRAIQLGVNGFLAKPIEIEQLKNVLYATTQTIADRKLVKDYYTQIEDLNITLEEKNHELKKSLRILDTMVNKEKISTPKIVPEITPNIDTTIDDFSDEIDEFKREDLHYLKDIHDEIDVSIIAILKSIENSYIDNEALDALIVSFSKYTSIISVYPFFKELSGALTSFINIMENEELPDDNESIKNIFMLLESFIFVLGKFNDEMISSEANNINQLDDSIINDIQTITAMWLNRFDDEIEAEEIEFF